jgi:hypothetical protein
MTALVSHVFPEGHEYIYIHCIYLPVRLPTVFLSDVIRISWSLGLTAQIKSKFNFILLQFIV